jgi:hypothetical protein
MRGIVVALSLLAFLLAGWNPAYGQREFRGVVEAMPGGGYVGTWVISGKTVEVTPQTEVKLKRGDINLGTQVKVHGFPQDGSYIVREIEASKGKSRGKK